MLEQPEKVVNTATDLVRRTAEVLGLSEEEKKYRELYHTTREAFRQEYYMNTG